MNVSELMALLSDFDPNATVMIIAEVEEKYMGGDGWANTTDVDKILSVKSVHEEVPGEDAVPGNTVWLKAEEF